MTPISQSKLAKDFIATAAFLWLSVILMALASSIGCVSSQMRVYATTSPAMSGGLATGFVIDVFHFQPTPADDLFQFSSSDFFSFPLEGHWYQLRCAPASDQVIDE